MYEGMVHIRSTEASLLELHVHELVGDEKAQRIY